MGITGGCGVVEPWAAALSGCVSGVLYMLASRGLVAIRLDDAVDAIPVHMANGIWGLISVGLFASPGRLEKVYGHSEHPGWFFAINNGEPGNMRLLGAQLVGILFIVGWVATIMLPFFIWLDWKGWFRSDPLEEIVGLDTSYHGGLVLLAHDDSVNPEYVSALKKQREEQGNLRRRRVGHLETTVESDGTTTPGGGDELEENGEKPPDSW